MTFKEAIEVCLKQKYLFKVAGRATRSEFWWFTLFMFLVNMAASALAAIFPPALGASLVAVISLLLFPASLGVTVRRLHDRNISGWWLFLPAGFLILGGFLGVLGELLAFGVCLAFLVIYCLPGTPGPNKYGPNTLMKY